MRAAALLVLGLAAVALPRPAVADGIMLVGAGAFWMGRDDGPPDEAPRHRVYVRAFWIDRHKVTNAEFAEFLNARGWVSAEGESRYDHEDADARVHQVSLGPPPHPAAGQPVRWVADPGFERHPVAVVTWFGARDSCAFKGRRLPTEAEWEKAARGADGRRYPWGDAPPAPHLGEWTSTTLQPYPYRHDDGREPWDGAGRVVVRGASHDDPAAELSVTLRRSWDRRSGAAGHHNVGFRCATSEDLGGR